MPQNTKISLLYFGKISGAVFPSSTWSQITNSELQNVGRQWKWCLCVPRAVGHHVLQVHVVGAGGGAVRQRDGLWLLQGGIQLALLRASGLDKRTQQNEWPKPNSNHGCLQVRAHKKFTLGEISFGFVLRLGNTVDGFTCDPTCKREENSCVQMTVTRRDKYNTVEYQTHFCGSAVDKSNKGKIVTKGCHKQKNLEELDVEACFCQGNFCNSAHGTFPNLPILKLSLSTFILLHGRIWNTWCSFFHSHYFHFQA